MARIWIMSDLHLEQTHIDVSYSNVVEHDVVVLAGDIMNVPTESMVWAEQKFMKPVILVAGNHEFYHCQLGHELTNARAKKAVGVHFLENQAVVVAGVRFLGCTLWTDYELMGDIERGMHVAATALTDHRVIKFGKRWFSPSDARTLHLESLAFLEREFAIGFDGPTVVVSHHAPSGKSVSPEFLGDILNPAFCSNLDDKILRWQPDLWIHGHTHSSCDYAIGRTRVICNPAGYGYSNRRFQRDLVVEVGGPRPRFEDGVPVDEYGFPIRASDLAPVPVGDDDLENTGWKP
jgi:predicted phosphodiesterase